MIRRQPRSTRTDTLFPYTTLFRSPEIATRMSNVPILPGTIRNQGRQSAKTIICRRKAAEKGEIRSTDSFTATILRPHIRLMRTTAIQSAAEKPAADALLRSFMPQFASPDHTALRTEERRVGKECVR